MGLEPLTGGEAEDVEVFANGERQDTVSVGDGEQINLGDLPVDIDIEGNNVDVEPDDSVSLTIGVQEVEVAGHEERGSNRNGVRLRDFDDFTQDEIEEAEMIEFFVPGIESLGIRSLLVVDGTTIDSDRYENIEYRRELGDSIMDSLARGWMVGIYLLKDEKVVNSVNIN